MNLEKIKNDISIIISEIGLSLYSVEYVQENDTNILRITVDRRQPINIDDVTKATDLINPYLDKEDPINEEYSLEVTSRGAEKGLNLEETSDYIGEYVFVKTFDQEHYGELISSENGSIILKIKNKKVAINYNDCLLIRLAIKF